jgi:flagellar FliJ protein
MSRFKLAALLNISRVKQAQAQGQLARTRHHERALNTRQEGLRIETRQEGAALTPTAIAVMAASRASRHSMALDLQAAMHQTQDQLRLDEKEYQIASQRTSSVEKLEARHQRAVRDEQLAEERLELQEVATQQWIETRGKQ